MSTELIHEMFEGSQFLSLIAAAGQEQLFHIVLERLGKHLGCHIADVHTVGYTDCLPLGQSHLRTSEVM